MADGPLRIGASALLCIALSGCVRPPSPDRVSTGSCVPRATWVTPTTRTAKSSAAIVEQARARRIVVLGERHDWVEDHRWQAHVLSVLHAAHPSIVVGFEMLTSNADAALARWAAGAASFEEFLSAVDWRGTTGLDPELYRPVFEAIRLLGLRAHGINVDRALVRRVATEGWSALGPDDRRLVPAPRPAGDEYRARLADAFAAHRCHRPENDDPAFARFVQAQRTWDAVMAHALGELADSLPDALVVGIVGRGHVEYRDGIVSDLVADGRDVLVLLPWEIAAGCDDLTSDLADAVFGTAPLPGEVPPPPPSLCPDDASTASRGRAADQRPR